MFVHHRGLVAAALICLAGCGGGGSSTPPNPAAPAATPTAASNVSPQSAHITLTFPVNQTTAASRKAAAAAKRAPKYVDGKNTVQLVTTITAIGGNTTLPAAVQPYATTTSPLTIGTGGNCMVSGSGTGETETCTLAIPAPAGSVSYTFNGEDGSGTVLETGSTTQTITLGTVNAFNVVLDGVPSQLVYSTSSYTTPNAGTPSVATNFPLAVADADFDSTISGTYASPVTIKSDSTHITFALAANVTAAATASYTASVVLTSSTDAGDLYFAYDGAALPNPAGAPYEVDEGGFKVRTGSISAYDSAPAYSGLATAGAANGSATTAVNYGDATYIFDAAGQTQSTASAAEAGFTPATYGSGQLTIALSSPQPTNANGGPNPGSDNGDGTTTASGCANTTNANAVVTALSIGAPDASGNETISATAGVAGICQVTVADTLGNSSTFFISVTTASGSIDARHRAAR